jgi:CRISPR system Cascade subunit CasA
MNHPPLNMITDPVFPIVTQSGARRFVCFFDLIQDGNDFPVSFDWPRGDLNIASAELAIGMLCLIYRPVSHKEWEAIWEGSSGIDAADRIKVLSPYFNLFGDAEGKGPRFCQDFEEISGSTNTADALFIDSPGINGQKKNTDLLTHRNRFFAISTKVAGIALYGLQQFAPSGGAGNRTSLRGGGPMTTLIIPRSTKSKIPLIHQLLVNLPINFGVDWLDDDELDRALPWLRQTITSAGEPPEEVAEASPKAHSVQAFFGMPRRIRLISNGSGYCPITGEFGPMVTGFVQKPWGVKYSTWRHPLTPYRQSKDDVPYTVKPKPGRFGFRDWVGISVGRANVSEKAFTAEAVAALNLRTRALRKRGYELQILAAGWAMNNMEAESYLYSVQPLYLAPDGRADIADDMSKTARDFATAAEDASRQLRIALNEALFAGKSRSIDTALFLETTDSFFERTENAFHTALLKLSNKDDQTTHEDRARAWLRRLQHVALSIFNEKALSQLTNTSDLKMIERTTHAYATLAGRLSATSRIGEALGVPQPIKEKNRKPAL